MGGVSLTSPIIKSDDGGKWFVDPDGSAKAADETVEEVSRLIEKRIYDKTHIKYAPGTALIIYIDDYGTFRSERHFAKLITVVEGHLHSLKKVFKSIYMITSLGSAFAEF